jgi:murein hydrolase activator
VKTGRTACLGLLLVFCAGGLAHVPHAAASAADAREELRGLRARIEALQKRLDAAEQSAAQAADALKESEQAISEANRSLRELARQAAGVKQRLAELRGEAERRGAALKDQQTLLSRLLYQQYLGGAAEPWRLLLNGEDPNEIARQLHYLARLSRARADLIGNLRAGVAHLQALARETERKADEFAAIAAEQRVQRQRLEQERRARAQVLARLSRDIGQQRREMSVLRRNEERLTRLIEELGRVVARPAPAPRPRDQRAPVPGEGGPFERLKGRLSLPVRGELGNRFGSPRSDGGLTWRGVFIAAPAGGEVRAVADGRVVFADWLRGFGNLLIVDHGGAYMSLYGNNETLYPRVGDVVRGGDVIATVGNSGGNPDSGLYFELRHQGKPLDPLAWLDSR